MAIQISNWVTELQKRTNLQGTDRILMGLSDTGESLYTTVADLAGVVTSSTVVNRGDWASGTEYMQGDYVFAESTASPTERSMYFLIGIDPYVSNIPPKDDLSKWSELPAIKGDQGPKGDKGDKGDPLTWDDLTPSQKDSLKGDVGDSGWSMLVRAEVDNVNLDPDGQYRKVLYVYDWVGGEGTKPTITGYIGVSGIVENIVNAENWRGSRGAQGIKGDAPAHEWVGTSVRFQNPNGTWGALTDLRGAQGIQGIKGDAPDHEWDDTRLRFQNTNGSWGAYVDLKGDKGDRGEAFKIDASGLFADRVDYDNEPEGFSFLATDLGEMYIREGAAGNWSDGIPFGKGDPGEGVPAGGTTGQLLRKKSNTDYDTEFFTLDLSQYATIIDLDGKVDKVAGKQLSDENYTESEKLKLASFNPAKKADLDGNDKIVLSQIPDVVLGQLKFGGTFNSAGVITPSTNFSDISSVTNIDNVKGEQYNGFFFISTGTFIPAGSDITSINIGDWIVVLSSNASATTWDKVDNTDAVQGILLGDDPIPKLGLVEVNAYTLDLVGDTGQLPFTNSAGTGIEKRKIAPEDLNMLTVGTILGNIAGNLGELNLSSSVVNSAVAQRTTYGSLKASNAVANDDLVALGQANNLYAGLAAGNIFTDTNVFQRDGNATILKRATEGYGIYMQLRSSENANIGYFGVGSSSANHLGFYSNTAGRGFMIQATGEYRFSGLSGTGKRLGQLSTSGDLSPINVGTSAGNIVDVQSDGRIDASLIAYTVPAILTANKTLSGTDKNAYIRVTGTRTITMPADLSTTDYPIGSTTNVRISTGATVNFVGASGVTLDHPDGAGNVSVEGRKVVSIVRVDTNAYDLIY